MLNYLQIKSFDTINSGTSGSFITSSADTRYISIPLPLMFKPTSDEDFIDNFIIEAKTKHINPILDFEKTRYLPVCSDDTTVALDNITFKFWFDDSVRLNNYDANSVNFDINNNKNKNVFKKSFFRLAFYDNPDPNNQKLIFNLILPAKNSLTDSNSIPYPEIKSTIRDEGYYIYWLKNDYLSLNTLYMRASFYSAKTGKFHTFILPDVDYPTFTTKQYTLEEYSNNFIALNYLQYNLLSGYRYSIGVCNCDDNTPNLDDDFDTDNAHRETTTYFPASGVLPGQPASYFVAPESGYYSFSITFKVTNLQPTTGTLHLNFIVDQVTEETRGYLIPSGIGTEFSATYQTQTYYFNAGEEAIFNFAGQDVEFQPIDTFWEGINEDTNTNIFKQTLDVAWEATHPSGNYFRTGGLTTPTECENNVFINFIELKLV